MTVESATYINQLNAALPGATDPKSEGDDHIRLVKTTVKATFPNVTGVVSATHTELGYVAGVTSAVQTQLNAKAPTASPTFTGTAVLPATTSIGATTGTELGYLSGVTSAVQTQLNAKAPLASPALTGTPTAPTAAAGTSTTQLATTEFVATTYAPLASPALTGTPTAPTAAAGTSTTQVATTAFVQNTAFNAALPSQTGNAGKYVTTNGTTASWATPFTPSVTMTAAGTIAAGQPCIVTAAGTAAQVGVTAGGTTLTVANGLSGPGTGYSGAVFLDTPKAFVSYGNSRRNFIAGTYGVAGVTWGTPVNWFGGAAIASTRVAFKSLPNSNIFLFFYTDPTTNFPTIVAGSVTGTTITVGTPVVVESTARTSFIPSIAPINSTTFALMYGEISVGGVRSCAGTVSGTTITLGAVTATADINGNILNGERLSAIWDPAASRVVFTYGSTGGTLYFTYFTASISGTTLTYNAAANLYSGALSGPAAADAAVYDTLRSQIIMVTENTITRSLSVSGATVTAIATTTAFGSPVYDSVNNLIVLNGNGAQSNTVTNSGAALTVNAASTNINSGAGICYDASTATIFGPSGTTLGVAKLGTTNLGTGNYVGIATNAASVGGTVTINTIGNTATITGLTPGSNYAVLNIGGLSPVTALTLGQYAGVAIGATTLLLKG